MADEKLKFEEERLTFHQKIQDLTAKNHELDRLKHVEANYRSAQRYILDLRRQVAALELTVKEQKKSIALDETQKKTLLTRCEAAELALAKLESLNSKSKKDADDADEMDRRQRITMGMSQLLRDLHVPKYDKPTYEDQETLPKSAVMNVEETSNDQEFKNWLVALEGTQNPAHVSPTQQPSNEFFLPPPPPRRSPRHQMICERGENQYQHSQLAFIDLEERLTQQSLVLPPLQQVSLSPPQASGYNRATFHTPSPAANRSFQGMEPQGSARHDTC